MLLLLQLMLQLMLKVLSVVLLLLIWVLWVTVAHRLAAWVAGESAVPRLSVTVLRMTRGWIVLLMRMMRVWLIGVASRRAGGGHTASLETLMLMYRSHCWRWSWDWDWDWGLAWGWSMSLGWGSFGGNSVLGGRCRRRLWFCLRYELGGLVPRGLVRGRIPIVHVTRREILLLCPTTTTITITATTMRNGRFVDLVE